MRLCRGRYSDQFDVSDGDLAELTAPAKALRNLVEKLSLARRERRRRQSARDPAASPDQLSPGPADQKPKARQIPRTASINLRHRLLVRR